MVRRIYALAENLTLPMCKTAHLSLYVLPRTCAEVNTVVYTGTEVLHSLIYAALNACVGPEH